MSRSFKKHLWVTSVLILLTGGGLWMLGASPLIAYLVAVNAITIGCYAWDKRSAQRQTARIPEWNLHTLALLGGSPGAWLARRMFRHKTLKRGFRWIYWVIVVLQCLLLLFWWAGPDFLE